METEITSLLNTTAPLKTGHRSGPRKAKNWLSSDAIEAKKRRLERRWNCFWNWNCLSVVGIAWASLELGRIPILNPTASLTALRANKLINKSRAASNIESINEASKNLKRLCSTLSSESLLHSSFFQWTTLTFHITTTGKFLSFFFFIRRLLPSKSTLTFRFWSATL